MITHARIRKTARRTKCPTCGAEPNQLCKTRAGTYMTIVYHKEREDLAVQHIETEEWSAAYFDRSIS